LVVTLKYCSSFDLLSCIITIKTTSRFRKERKIPKPSYSCHTIIS